MSAKNTKTIPHFNIQNDMCIFWSHGGKGYMAHFQHDTNLPDPRREYDHLCTMACFHKRHDLGDEMGGGIQCSEDFWSGLVRKEFSAKTLYDRLVNQKNSTRFLERLADNDIDIHDINEVIEEFYAAVEDGDLHFAMDVLDGRYAWLPIWLYDHSGLTISCGERTYPYNDQWDSGLLGWCVVSKERVISELKANDSDWKEKADAAIRSEVREYDQYLTGDIWWFEVKSCHGRYDIVEHISGPRGEGSEESDWDDEDSCGGFCGSDLAENGMPDHIGNGFQEALLSGDYETGEAIPENITIWQYWRSQK